jgi:hypothetical protein
LHYSFTLLRGPTKAPPTVLPAASPPSTPTTSDTRAVYGAQTARRRAALYRIVSRGRVDLLAQALGKLPPRVRSNPDHPLFVDDAKQRTLIHVCLSSAFGAITAGADRQAVRRFDDTFALLLRYVNATAYCPLVDAVHYRLQRQIRALVAHLQAGALRACLFELDTNGEHVLHIASKSKASGFARYFLGHAHQTRRLTQSATTVDDALNVSWSKVLSTSAANAAVNKITSATFSTLNHDTTIGASDLALLLETGASVGLGQRWLQFANAVPQQSPLLVACRAGRVRPVELLIQASAAASGGDTSPASLCREGRWNMSCAHLAAVGGHIGVLQKLVEMKAYDASVRDAFGRSAADVACAAGSVTAARFLVGRAGDDDHRQRCLRFFDAASKGLKTSARAVFRCALHDSSSSSSSSSSSKLSVAMIMSRCTSKFAVNGGDGRGSEDGYGVTDAQDAGNDDGGWGTGTASTPAASVQDRGWRNVPRIDGTRISETDFARDYFTLLRPVIMSGLGVLDWPARSSWRRPAFLASRGDIEVLASGLPYPDLYGVARRKVTLLEYVQQWTEEPPKRRDGDVSGDGVTDFVFEGSQFFNTAKLQADIVFPPLLANLTMDTNYLKQFSIGPSGSGAQPHFHGNAWNALVFGTKRWAFVQAPTGLFSVDAVRPTRWTGAMGPDWAVEVGTQLAGDVVWVPEMHSHSTLNLAPSLAVACESN